MRTYISLQAFIFVVLIGLISNSSAWASFEEVDLKRGGEINMTNQIYGNDKSVDRDNSPEVPSLAILAASDNSEKKKRKAKKKKNKKNKKNKKSKKKSKDRMNDKDRDDEL
ncbi:hypothetical protein HON22_05630, partial [Candidatus Peregrinibacteria bacterium]|nr:hypothetical protein [Candidatus Peregrinibacteria bacterium]